MDQEKPLQQMVPRKVYNHIPKSESHSMHKSIQSVSNTEIRLEESIECSSKMSPVEGFFWQRYQNQKLIAQIKKV